MSDQFLIFSLLILIFIVFALNRVRYDMVAFAALIIASVIGLVPTNEVFLGFGHPAVIIVALVLIISRGLVYSGAVELITQHLSKFISNVTSHIVIMGSVSAILSSFINNIAALAILMPADISINKKAKRNPSNTLMALSFASILGGMITMIGTAPNIVIATYRGETLGEPYGMFDFFYVGIIVAIVGVIFISFVGWRLIPNRTNPPNYSEAFEETKYVANTKITSTSNILGQRITELNMLCDDNGISILGVIRDGQLFEGSFLNFILQEDDLLVLNGPTQGVDHFIAKTKTQYTTAGEREIEIGQQSLVEVVVPLNAVVVGKSAIQLGLLKNKNTSLLGISRRGESLIDNVRQAKIKAGDVLLLHGNSQDISSVIDWIECLPLADRGLEIPDRKKAWQAIAIFAIAIVASAMNFVYLPVALSAVIICYLAFKIVPPATVYKSINWPVIVLLGSMIPIGNALNDSGGAATIASGIVELTSGYSAVVVLTIILIITMTLSDVLNNVATVLIAAPISIDIAQRLNANPDAFLMAVAVGASCAFLTPIGHQNNSIILGPGGYKFSDYWRFGLAVELIVVAVSVPSILVFWPL